MKSAVLVARNQRICQLRKSGKKVKEIALMVSSEQGKTVSDAVVALVLRQGGESKPHPNQLGAKPNATKLVDRPRCLACGKSYRAPKGQFRCDPCLKRLSGVVDFWA